MRQLQDEPTTKGLAFKNVFKIICFLRSGRHRAGAKQIKQMILETFLKAVYQLITKLRRAMMSLKQAIEVRENCIYIKNAKLKPKQRIRIQTDDGYTRYMVKTKNNKLIMN